MTIAESASLKLRRLGSQEDQTLVLGLVAGERDGDGWFRTSAVNALFEAFRIAPPNYEADFRASPSFRSEVVEKLQRTVSLRRF